MCFTGALQVSQLLTPLGELRQLFHLYYQGTMRGIIWVNKNAPL